MIYYRFQTWTEIYAALDSKDELSYILSFSLRSALKNARKGRIAVDPNALVERAWDQTIETGFFHFYVDGGVTSHRKRLRRLTSMLEIRMYSTGRHVLAQIYGSRVVAPRVGERVISHHRYLAETYIPGHLHREDLFF